MKILQINTVYAKGSTGHIAKNLHDLCKENQIECLTGCRCIDNGQEAPEDVISVSSKWDSRIHGWLSRFTMFKGAGSFFKTAAFLKKAEKFKPDVIHLHNLHGSYINLPALFRFIRKHRIPVVWTLHDCWAFTAICSHFTLAGCDQWKTGCRRCPQRKRFSSSPFDFSKIVWSMKKRWLSNLPNVTVVTPSDWLSEEVRSSFLKDYTVMTIHNGIDLQIFSPTNSDFKEKNKLENQKIILGVSSEWGERKGLDVFVSLAKRLADGYKIILVGIDEETGSKLPENILTVHHTNDQKELAEIYSAADVFVNPTREDTFPTVNLEALACGTPVITFRTGGSPECIDVSCGVAVDVDDVDALEREIVRVCSERPYTGEACRNRAELFDKTKRFEEYLALYMELV